MTMQHPVRTELWAILRLAGPLIASQLAHMLMVLTDTLMMARLSPEALAGGGLGAAPMMSPAPLRIATSVPTAAITPMQKIDTNE